MNLRKGCVIKYQIWDGTIMKARVVAVEKSKNLVTIENIPPDGWMDYIRMNSIVEISGERIKEIK